MCLGGGGGGGLQLVGIENNCVSSTWALNVSYHLHEKVGGSYCEYFECL